MKLSINRKYEILPLFRHPGGGDSAAGQIAPESVVLAIVNGDSIFAEQLEGELMRIHSGQQETSRAPLRRGESAG